MGILSGKNNFMDEKDIVLKIVEVTALEAYKDSAKPALMVVGKALGQCVSLFTTPIGRTAKIFEKNINKYLDKLEGFSEAELISPDTRILVPILDKMRYTEDELVSNYYAEILSAASKKETKGKVLLTFIEILNRVTADEIKILEFINSPKNFITIDATILTEEERTKFNLPNSHVDILCTDGIPIIDVKIENTNKIGYELVLNNFNLLPDCVLLEFPESINSYLDNLISLGLLHIPNNKKFALNLIYKNLKEHKNVKEIESKLINGDTISFAESRIDLTSLSLSLLSICKKII